MLYCMDVKTLSLTLREDHWLRVFENKVQKSFSQRSKIDKS
jgi:hypothetical protein